MAAHTEHALELICVEETNYAPVRWQRVQYVIDTGVLEPMLEDTCMQAQALAFCRSYLRRFAP